jgi:hypothetical protein
MLDWGRGGFGVVGNRVSFCGLYPVDSNITKYFRVIQRLSKNCPTNFKRRILKDGGVLALI